MNALRIGAALAVAAALICGSLAAADAPTPGRDPVLSALEAELARSVERLRLDGVEKPYFISYTVTDTNVRRVEATFGAVVRSTVEKSRRLRTDVRVGSYDVDSSEFLAGRSPYERMDAFPRMLVTDDDEMAIRHEVWLATDEAYKAAAERLEQKKAVLANRVEKDPVPDFSREKPFVSLAPRRAAPEPGEWPERVKRLSAIFRELPDVQESSLVLTIASVNRTFVNSEGTRVRVPSARWSIEVQASTQAEDGAPLKRALSFHEVEPSRLPAEAVLGAAIRKMAAELSALRVAPVLESYTGPVLFADEAAPTLFADLFAPQLSGRRPPLSARPTTGGAEQGSELAGRLGRLVLPVFLGVVDDPTLASDGGRTLLGSYDVDDEGVPARTLTLVDRGVLKTLAMGRRPRKEIAASNGHARGSSYFAPAPAVSNLLVRASSGRSHEELKKELIQQATAQGLPFALLVRALGPGRTEETDMFEMSFGEARPRSPLGDPALAWKVYPDGREELVRGLSFGPVAIRDLRDISAAGTDTWVLSRPSSVGAHAPVSVVAPELLFPDLELRRDTSTAPKPPLLSNPWFDKKTAGKGAKKR